MNRADFSKWNGFANKKCLSSPFNMPLNESTIHHAKSNNYSVRITIIMCGSHRLKTTLVHTSVGGVIEIQKSITKYCQ